jgi:hypothetical protein
MTTEVAAASPDVSPQRGLQVGCERARVHPVGPPYVFVVNKELIQVRKRTDPANAEEPSRRARPDPGHEPPEVVTVRESHSSPLGEPLERAREHEARPGHEIALPQDDVCSEVVSGPSLEQSGHRRPQLVEHVAQLLSLLRVEGEIVNLHARQIARSGSAERQIWRWHTDDVFATVEVHIPTLPPCRTTSHAESAGAPFSDEARCDVRHLGGSERTVSIWTH